MPVTELDPRTALVLIDLQQGIGAMAPSNVVENVVAASARLATAFRAQHLPVVLVHVDFSPDGGDAPRTRSTMSIAGMALPPNWASTLPGLGRQPSDLLVIKRQAGAFYGTDLDLQLRRRKVTGIVLGGLFTGMGVESTGRAAADHGYNVSFASDAMADFDPAVHVNSVTSVFPRFGEVGDTDSILALLGRRAAA